MKTIVILTFLLLGTARLTSHAAILEGPIVNPANGHAYYLLQRTNATAAETEALTLGGHLVTISDAQENAWVHQTFSAGRGLVWIGLHRKSSTSFGWMSGEYLAYANWAPGEPNNARGDENYGIMYQSGSVYGAAGSWNDIPEDFVAAYGQPNPYAVVEVVVPVLSISRTFEICWFTETNKQYQIEWTPLLPATNWVGLGPPVTGTGQKICVFDSTREGQARFYRVQRIQ